MRKIGLLVATAAATLAIAQPASAISSPQLQIAGSLCQQQGGVFYLAGGSYSCKGTMTLFDLVKAKTVCSLLFGGSLSLLSPVEVPILLLPNGGYRCSFGTF